MTAKIGNANESFHKADSMTGKPGKGRYDFSDLSISTHIRSNDKKHKEIQVNIHQYSENVRKIMRSFSAPCYVQKAPDSSEKFDQSILNLHYYLNNFFFKSMDVNQTYMCPQPSTALMLPIG
jgi:hypothetical protein